MGRLGFGKVAMGVWGVGEKGRRGDRREEGDAGVEGRWRRGVTCWERSDLSLHQAAVPSSFTPSPRRSKARWLMRMLEVSFVACEYFGPVGPVKSGWQYT